MVVDLVLANAKAYVDNRIVGCSLAIDNGKVVRIAKEAHMPKADSKIDLKNVVVLPGLIDAHVHLRDEGKTHKEDFYSGTAAAAAGGVTSVLDMPNNEPVTMSAETLKNRMEKARNKILVDVGFYSEFPMNMEEIGNIVDCGAVAFKLFMAEQVGGLNIDDDSALLEAFKTTSESKALVAVHAEDKTILREAETKLERSDRNDVQAFLKAHSEEVEVKAIKRLVRIAKKTHGHVHFCHVSTENGLKEIVKAKKTGLPITCEATPHHLLLSAEEFERVGTLALTMPPIRGGHHAEALWRGISDGSIDTLGSDHAPHTVEEKRAKMVWDVKVGIPNLETTLPLFLTEIKKGRLSMTDFVRLMSEKPAAIFRLDGRGCLKEGNRADLTIVDLKRKYKIDASKFHSKAKYSPFDQWTVEGKPTKTFVSGQLIMDEGEIVAKAGSGSILRRKRC